MKMIKTLLLICGLTLPTAVIHALEVGQSLPSLQVQTKGELLLAGDDVTYRPWSTTAIQSDRPSLIFHVPPRISSQSIIKPLRSRLESEGYQKGQFQSITVINLQEAAWGTTGMIISQLQEDKTSHPEASFVIDDKNRGTKAWSVGKRDVVIAVVDANGIVQHIHTGEMTEGDVNTIISELNAQIDKAGKLATN